MMLLEQSGRILRTSRSETMKAMKWILAVMTTTMIMVTIMMKPGEWILAMAEWNYLFSK